jgi:hypothetical protein
MTGVHDKLIALNQAGKFPFTDGFILGTPAWFVHLWLLFDLQASCVCCRCGLWPLSASFGALCTLDSVETLVVNPLAFCLVRICKQQAKALEEKGHQSISVKDMSTSSSVRREASASRLMRGISLSAL